MSSVLIFSSYVVTSRVGGLLQAMTFSAAGVEAYLIPSVLYGRHPGYGPPGGGAVGPETYRGVIDGAQAQNALGADLILTGYFALPEQVVMAADAIDRARQAKVKPIVLVDPILGDDGPGLYVRPEVEQAIHELLIPRADVLAPNFWELQRIAKIKLKDAEGAAKAARAFGQPLLVSSIPCGADQIGVLYVDKNGAWLASHAKMVDAPKGTGDLLKALFAVGLIQATPRQTALARAVGGVADAVEAALVAGRGELSLAGLGDLWAAPTSRVQLAFVA